MFKRCALSEKSNKVFSEIVGSLGDGYLPHNFTTMIVYLVYLSKREELRRDIEKEKTGIRQKVERVEDLLKLRDLSINNERVNMSIDAFRHNLKNRFRDLWEKVNNNYGQKFPYTPKVEEEFY